jgi:scyllo-inositol 2-dehydrogenase (NADP+)
MGRAKIKIGVAGLGRIGWIFHCAEIARHPAFAFVAVQDPEPDRRVEAKQVYGVRTFERFDDMLAEGRLDAVAIAAPTHLHRGMAIAALNAGCHVMLEKPMAPTADDAEAIVRAAARRERILTVYQPRRADASFQHLRALLASGIIGEVYHARIGMFQLSLRDDWQALRRFGGGMLNNYGAHGLDQLLQLLGYDVRKVFCTLRRVASVGDAEDVVKVVLQTAGGALGELDINQASTINPYLIDVWGTRGALSLPPGDRQHFIVRRIAAGTIRPRKLVTALASTGRRYPDAGGVSIRESRIRVNERQAVDVYADFARAIRSGTPPFVRPEEPLAVMRLIGRCRGASGRIVVTSLYSTPERGTPGVAIPGDMRH